MSITISGGGFRRLLSAKKTLEANMQGEAAKALHTALELEKTRILEKTEQSKDYLGKPFKKYSKSYLAFKKSIGRLGNVDLTLSGLMLQSLRTMVDVDQGGLFGRIYILGKKNRDKARGHQFGNPKKRLPIRKFIGLDNLAIKNIATRLKTVIGF